MPPDAAPAGRGLTVSEVASRLRVSEDKVRGWIRRGELIAINVADSLLGKPRWTISHEALAAFENLRTSAPPPAPPRRRRKAVVEDFYPHL
jgi:excisionase family DNA binding protein